MPELIDADKLKQIIDAALMAADQPLTVDQLQKLFAHGELDSDEGRAQIRDTLSTLEQEAEGRGYELKRVASGYRYQVRRDLAEWVSRLWEEKPPRYSRALLETLALIAYKQPVTRGDIEQVRGVAVSQNIMRTLLERGWIRSVGQREVPGKPSLYGTTREFLDYFDLKSLDQLPPLAEIRSLIEPLVMEEVAEEAREVAERDHPELKQVLSHDQSTDTEPTTDAGSEEGRSEQGRSEKGEEADAEEIHEHQRADPARDDEVFAEAGDVQDREPERSGVGEDAEDAEDAGEGEEAGRDEAAKAPAHSAEVVRLPTPRR